MAKNPRPVLFLVRPVAVMLPDAVPDGVRLVTYSDLPSATETWLRLHSRCFGGKLPRPWSDREFQREFLGQPWWSPSRMWFAREARTEEVVGTVTLAATGDAAHLHWLLVAPTWRRRGVARALLATAQQAASALGCVTLRAETAASWSEAVAFYRQAGFAPI